MASPPDGLLEAVPAYDTVGLYVDSDRFRPETVATRLGALPAAEIAPGRRHEIPVCYALGDDLAAVAQALQLSEADVVREHTGQVYECRAIGFCPGFPYLAELPPALAGLPRRAEPRVRVEPGSVAITGRQTGVYPLARPGGWWLLGRTPLTLVDVEEGFFPIEPGDEVAFRAIDLSEFHRRVGERL